MDHDDYPDALLRRILREVRTIAMVGASPNWVRPSYFAMKYLQEKGYRVIPVNPSAAGETILGETVYANLAAIPDRRGVAERPAGHEAAGAVVDEAIAVARDKGIKVIWMQLGVRNDAAAARAEKAGLTVIMNRCPKIEYGRLFHELAWSGINTRVISARRPRLRA